MERSSRLVQDLVEMVTKTPSIRTDSSLDISIRPPSTSTSETGSSESVTPAQCSSLMSQEPRTESSIAVVKTESLWIATTPPLLSNGPEKPIGTHNTEFTATIKTEPPSEISSPQNNLKDHKTAYPSIASIKSEPEMMEVTPDVFSSSINSLNAIKPEHDFMPVISKISSLSSDFQADRATVKTEPQSTPVSSEISPPETIPKHNLDSMSSLKTEPSFTNLKSEQPETIPSLGPNPVKPEPQLAVISSETSSLASDLDQTETILYCNSEPDETTQTSLSSNSEQDDAISADKSPSTDKAAAEQRESSKSPEPLEKPQTRLRSSSAVSSSAPSSRKETTRKSSPLDESDEEPSSPASSGDSYHPPSKSSKNDESDDTEDPDSAAQSDDSYCPPSKSSKNKAKKSTSKVTSPSSRITKPVAAPVAAPVATAAPAPVAAPAPAPVAAPALAAKPLDSKQSKLFGCE